jgi:hypothetical protein
MKEGGSYRGEKFSPFAFASRLSVFGGGKYLPPNHSSGLSGPVMLNADEVSENIALSFPGQSVGGANLVTLTRSNRIAFNNSPDSPYQGLKSISLIRRIRVSNQSPSILHAESSLAPERLSAL